MLVIVALAEDALAQRRIEVAGELPVIGQLLRGLVRVRGLLHGRHVAVQRVAQAMAHARAQYLERVEAGQRGVE